MIYKIAVTPPRQLFIEYLLSAYMTNTSVLSAHEELVYTSALELGPTTVQLVARKAKLPRSTVYLILDELEKKNLITRSQNQGKTTVSAESPDRLLTLAKSHESEARETVSEIMAKLPSLMATYSQVQDKPFGSTQDKPPVAFFEGLQGLKTLFSQSLETKEVLFLCSGSVKSLSRDWVDYVNRIYLPQTDRRKIIVREIMGETPDRKMYMDKRKSKTHFIKPYPGLLSDSHTDKLIFGDSVAIISVDKMKAVVLTNPQIVDLERSQFVQLWNSI